MVGQVWTVVSTVVGIVQGGQVSGVVGCGVVVRGSGDVIEMTV